MSAIPSKFLRAVWLAIVGLTLNLAPAIAAETVLTLNSEHPSLQVDGTVQILLEAGPSVGVDNISKRDRGSFSPAPAEQIFALAEGRTLWIRLRLQRAANTPAEWTLNIPLPYLDHVTLHSPNGKGGWSAQTAGDMTAVERWSHPGMYPEFSLKVPDDNPADFYLEVRNFKPIALPLMLDTAQMRDRQHELECVILGVLMGMLFMLIGVCAIHYLQSRSRPDGWYTLYATLVALVVGNATGLTGMWLWPTSPVWANYANMALPVLGVGATVLFVRHLASLDVGFPRLARVLYGFGLSALPLALLSAATDRQVADSLNAIYLGTGPVLAICATVLSWRRGYALSKWLFMAYLPQGLAVFFMAAQMARIAPQWWQARYVMVLAVAVAVPILQQALHIRIRERREAEERAKALPTQDALTGLLTAPLFMQQVATALTRAKQDRESSAIVLVDVVNFSYLRDLYGDATAEQCLLRAAVKLHRVLRDVDPAGRVGTSRFGLVLDGVSSRQVLTERMVRLIASGLIPLPGLKPEVTLQFHVACVLLTEIIPDEKTILDELGDVLENISPRTRRPIRFLEPALTIPAPISENSLSELPTQPNV